MEAKKYLKNYAQKADSVLDEFFAEKKKEAQAISPIAAGMIDRYRQFMVGGKKLRGAEIKLGYELCGKRAGKEVIKASTSIEIIHSFLLMHDDFMDQDDLRRGQPTSHKQYEKGHTPHFGLSMAVDTGDLGMFLAYEMLIGTHIPPKQKTAAWKILNETIIEVAYGQALDLHYESRKKVIEEDVLRVHTHKTATYTVTAPLQMGAVLGGASKQKLQALEKFGRPVGIAFQLRDDELGMFSDEKTLGKPADSDLKEGKNTLLFVKALELGDKKQKKFIKYAHGNSNLTVKEVEKVRHIIIDTGALACSQKLGRKLVEKGKKFVPQITKDSRHQETLYSLADFIIERES
jgi:geranylgeranyl diphosphate synthase type I